MDPDRVGPPAADLTSVDVDGSANIYVPGTERVVTLNDTATAIWRLATGEHTADEIVQLLAADYAVPAADIRDDVLRTIEEFRSEGLLTGSTATGTEHIESPNGDAE